MIQASLITRDTGIDLIDTACRSFIHKLWISQEGARHRHHIRRTIRNDLFRLGWHVDAIRGDHGNRDCLTFKRPETLANAARGTDVTIVGTRASCQPMPVLNKVTPAFSKACATATTSSQLLPPLNEIKNRMAIHDDEFLADSSARTRLTISTGKRMRFSIEPPQRSVR